MQRLCWDTFPFVCSDIAGHDANDDVSGVWAGRELRVSNVAR